MTETEELLSQIVPGLYEYASEKPEGCRGHHYRVHRSVLSVPTYQHMVLVEALDGPDTGLWFVCSLANFAPRYRLLEAQPAAHESV